MAGLGLVRNVTNLTKEDLIKRFPSKKRTITDEVVDLINETSNNPDFNGTEFVDTMVEYRDIMEGSGASIKEYINALKFCAYLESGTSLLDAYKKARASDEFVIERANDPVDSEGYGALLAAASRYRKNRLVKQILTQSDMPLYLMFQAERYKAVAVLSREMQTAKYSKDRITAADKLLAHVKAPENVQVELEVGLNKEAKSMQQSLEEQLAVIATQQKKLMDAGADIKSVQRLGIKADIIDAEVEDE